MIRLAWDVKLGLSPEIMLAIFIAEGVWHEHGADELVITSGREGVHKPGSYHYQEPGQAVDLRSKNLPEIKRQAARDALASRLGPSYRVLLEHDPPHVHVEYRG